MRYVKKKYLLIFICIILGVFLSITETKYIKSTFSTPEYVPVVFTKENLTVNSPLNKDNLIIKKIPKELFSINMVSEIESVQGKVAGRDIKEGLPLEKNDCVLKPVPILGEGMVRVTFTTNLSDGLAGKIYAGDLVHIGYVDKDGLNAIKLFENVMINYITDRDGNELNMSKSGKKNEFDVKNIPATVTVIIDAEEAVTLKKHETLGKVFLMGK